MKKHAILSRWGINTMNLCTIKTPMPIQQPNARVLNFEEVALGYTMEAALNEADRCLNCKNAPCVEGCPVNIPIPKFIQQIKNGDIEKAYNIISLSSSLPAVCGRVCPQETQCEAKCTRGIKGEAVAIGNLERFVADNYNTSLTDNTKPIHKIGIKVAVIGSGPSGLACAGELIKNGIDVTVFEALHKSGGVLMYGIPQFRLPKDIVNKEINLLKSMGVEFKNDIIIGKTITIDEIFDDGYDYIYIGTGAGLPGFMGIKGETLKGVYSANEFLTRINLMGAYKTDSYTPIMHGERVAVVGGGNVAMDAARCALRLGAKKVYIIYRRSMEELPARAEEVKHAKEEGIDFRLLTNPLEIIPYCNEEDKYDIKNGFVKALKCIKMELGEPDERGRRRPIEIKDSEFVLDVDTVIMALGTSPNPLIKNSTPDLNVTPRGGIIVNEFGLTSKENVYAGGDAVTGAATVISAMGAGKIAAKNILSKLL